MTNGNSAHPPVLDPRRLWAGGLATALVAALIAVVGVVIATGLFEVDVIAPRGFAGTEAVNYAVAAAIGALLATGLIHVLIAAVPRPFSYFNWIMGLAIVVVTLLPFASSQELPTKVATALINLVTGVAITSLTSGTAARLARQGRRSA